MERRLMRKQSQFPPGWDEARVRRVLEHYEAQSDEEAVAEHDASDEVTRLGLLGASRDGRVLHLTNDVTVGGDGLDAWAVQIIATVAKDPEDREGGWAAAAIRRLFDEVVLHAGDREVRVPVKSDTR